MMSVEIKTIPITAIRMDKSCQPRAIIDSDAVNDYKRAMQRGAKFPPVVVFFDGVHYWCANGHHTVKAGILAGLDEIDCDVREGTLEDAQWHSYAANATNGLRRTREDLQRAVKAALLHPRSAGLSNVQLAEHVACDEGTIRHWREKLTSEVPKSTTRTGRDRRTINTKNIGKARVQRMVGSRNRPQKPEAPASGDGVGAVGLSVEGANRPEEPTPSDVHVTIATVIRAARQIVEQVRTAPVEASGILHAVAPGSDDDRIVLAAAEILRAFAGALIERDRPTNCSSGSDAADGNIASEH